MLFITFLVAIFYILCFCKIIILPTISRYRLSNLLIYILPIFILSYIYYFGSASNIFHIYLSFSLLFWLIFGSISPAVYLFISFGILIEHMLIKNTLLPPLNPNIDKIHAKYIFLISIILYIILTFAWYKLYYVGILTNPILEYD